MCVLSNLLQLFEHLSMSPWIVVQLVEHYLKTNYVYLHFMELIVFLVIMDACLSMHWGYHEGLSPFGPLYPLIHCAVMSFGVEWRVTPECVVLVELVEQHCPCDVFPSFCLQFMFINVTACLYDTTIFNVKMIGQLIS